MFLFLVILCLFLIVALGVTGRLLFVATKRLLEFDDMVNYFVDDVETNIRYFDKLTNTPLFSDAPELIEATKNMMFMSSRLDEYMNRFEELTGKNIRKKTVPKKTTKLGE